MLKGTGKTESSHRAVCYYQLMLKNLIRRTTLTFHFE